MKHKSDYNERSTCCEEPVDIQDEFLILVYNDARWLRHVARIASERTECHVSLSILVVTGGAIKTNWRTNNKQTCKAKDAITSHISSVGYY